MKPAIYLDNNATTRVAPEVLEAMLPWLGEEGYGNPSSAYALGRAAAKAVEEARARLASLVACGPEEIVFTSCGTESINAAIGSALAIDPDNKHIVTSAVEHSATVKACEHLARRGYEITWLPVDAVGRLDLDQLEAAIRPDTALVTLLWANNETGVVFPVHEIAEIARKKMTVLHVDAVQGLGKLPISLGDSGIHFFSVSGHKTYAPKGVGALYVNRRSRFTPLLRGSQESGRRGGTQNVASIAGFGKAAESAAEHIGSRQVKEWRDAFEEHVLASVPGTRVNGDRENRLPNTTNISFEGIDSEAALILFDQSGLCCSAGSACASASVNPSHVLKAMGLTNEQARSSLRFSFGRFNSASDLRNACVIVPETIAKLRALSPPGSPVATA